MKIKFNFLLLLSAGLFIFLFSLYIAPFHINGDQVHYLAAYEEMRGSSLNDGFMVYQSYIFTEEPIHFLISWFFSNIGVSKNITMAFFNSILVILFAKILLIKKYPYWLILILLFNSYVMVLLFTLERNKIALIFIFMLVVYKKFLLYIPALFSHASTIILLLPSFFLNFWDRRKSTFSKNIYILFFIILFLICLNFLFHHLSEKLLAYADPELSDGMPPLLLFIIFSLALAFTKNKKNVLIFFGPLLILYFFIGPTRLNMYGFFLYLYLSNARNKYFQAVTGLIGVYMLFKSFIYIDMVITSGG